MEIHRVSDSRRTEPGSDFFLGFFAAAALGGAVEGLLEDFAGVFAALTGDADGDGTLLENVVSDVEELTVVVELVAGVAPY